MVFLEREALMTLQGILITIFASIVVGTPILKGYEYIEYKMEIKLPWLKSPIKRLVYTILFQASFLSVVLIIFLFFLYGFQSDFVEDTMMSTFWAAAIPGIGFSILATLVANSVSFFVNWKNAAVQQEVLKREKLSLEYETLKSQINPHFLFNSFTALSSLVYKDQDKAVEFIRELSNVYRYVLDQKDKELVSLEQELEFVKAVAYLYSIRYENNLVVNFNVDFDKDDMVVPISLQILFENAVKHNVISEKFPLTIDIFREIDTIVVRNSIQPRTRLPQSSRIGLANISRQYQLLGAVDIEIIKDDKEFIVKIPILKASQ
jgi:LytS/YehU family sensor histidine kinase